jgi:hypothetical protein
MNQLSFLTFFLRFVFEISTHCPTAATRLPSGEKAQL